MLLGPLEGPFLFPRYIGTNESILTGVLGDLAGIPDSTHLCFPFLTVSYYTGSSAACLSMTVLLVDCMVTHLM